MLKKNFRYFSQGYSLRDYYSILGIRFGATQKEIRTAYLTMAKQFHPDAPTGNTDKFKQVALAYETLKDSKNKPFQAVREPDPRVKKPDQEAKDEPFSRFEEEERAYQEWKENRSWTKSPKNQDSEHNGHEYFDPSLKQNERYTYTQFKQDKYSNSYRENPRRQSRPSGADEKSSYSGFLAFGCLLLFGSSRV